MTAQRLARILKRLGGRVTVSEDWTLATPADCMVAIHAWRSAPAIARFHDRFPDRPLIVLLAGTDVNRFQYSDPETTLASMTRATRLVGLHDLLAEAVPPVYRHKVRIIHQSASPLVGPRWPSRAHFDLCVVGHVREEKDALRAAFAARRLPVRSRVRIIQVGAALDDGWLAAITQEMDGNPRLIWRGEVPRWQVRELYRRCRAMVISSRQEGGANVISEAVVAGLPVFASDIPGNVGLLGPEHPALFPVADTHALAALMRRAEFEPGFLDWVQRCQARRAHLFTARREREAWGVMLRELAPDGEYPTPHA